MDGTSFYTHTRQVHPINIFFVYFIIHPGYAIGSCHIYGQLARPSVKLSIYGQFHKTNWPCNFINWPEPIPCHSNVSEVINPSSEIKKKLQKNEGENRNLKIRILKIGRRLTISHLAWPIGLFTRVVPHVSSLKSSPSHDLT
ncbi:hypothetical protein BpHYR1_026993 [Brachionus plicatilis]|uniref:Uncharacterized protein n=1 Tax=Brachionus plicatilis TaxID=10195 RepID=A0A3M7SPI6_BRAPC|nr:hypothetical protein BpHYR1_026993 [Brachionus plicatilis]